MALSARPLKASEIWRKTSLVVHGEEFGYEATAKPVRLARPTALQVHCRATR